jgi:hypothetical protein
MTFFAGYLADWHCIGASWIAKCLFEHGGYHSTWVTPIIGNMKPNNLKSWRTIFSDKAILLNRADQNDIWDYLNIQRKSTSTL